MTQKSIESFLNFGYFLDYKNPTYVFDFSQVNKNLYKNNTEDDLIKKGTQLLINSIDRLFEYNKNHVVPLSGGLDSRAILAILLEFTESTKIQTYTFGTPGTLDYEIGNKVARLIGTKHKTFPLTEYVYNMEELLDISKKVDHQTVLFHHPPISKLKNLFGESVIWSGFFGDPLVGSFYSADNHKDINSAKFEFINKNTYQKEIELIKSDINSFYELIEINSDGEISITTSELLNFYNRQLKFIAPHVLMKGFNYKTPFLDQDLVNFFLSIDNKYRENQHLYKKILLTNFKQLFSYPVKNNHGLPLNAPQTFTYIKRIYNRVKRTFSNTSLYINYLDFDVKIREKEDLREIIRENIYDLHNRKIIDWLDVGNIYEDHLMKKGNYGKALLLLCSLEIHMKAKKLGEK